MKIFISMSVTPVVKALQEATAKLVAELKAEFPLTKFSLSTIGKNLYINVIVVDKAAAGEGVGSKVIKRVIAFADKNYLTLQATPATKDDGLGTTSKNRLLRFYKGLGFKYNMGHKADYALDAGCVYIRPKKEQPEKVDDISYDAVTRVRHRVDREIESKLKAKYKSVECFASGTAVDQAIKNIAAAYPPVAMRGKTVLIYPSTEVGVGKDGTTGSYVFVAHIK